MLAKRFGQTGGQPHGAGGIRAQELRLQLGNDRLHVIRVITIPNLSGR
ncbi:hypothetical protein [Paenibacillus methanolicus]|nr:hypothetical protein [Paenibacillus methanolicus]